jgi:hypothetical protein
MTVGCRNRKGGNFIGDTCALLSATGAKYFFLLVTKLHDASGVKQLTGLRGIPDDLLFVSLLLALLANAVSVGTARGWRLLISAREIFMMEIDGGGREQEIDDGGR